MTALPCITAFAWVPEFARGFVRDLRPRWAFEEVGQPYEVNLIRDAKTPEHRRVQPFGQVPTYKDDEVEMFESGAMVIRIAERAGKLIPTDTMGRVKALQWVAAALNTMEPSVLQIAANEVLEADRSWSADRRPVVIANLEKRLQALEDYLGDRTWLEGEEFTIGDLMMVSVLGGLRGRNLLGKFPRVAAYVARGEARPAFRKAMADHLAGFEEAVAA